MKVFKKNNLNFYKMALLFMIPICAQSLIETLINLMNNFVVGQFGNDDAIAGVASSSNIYDMVWYIFFAIVVTGNIFTAQYLGVNNKKKIQETSNIKLFYTLLFSIFFVAILELFSKQIMGAILGAEDNSHQAAISVAEEYSKLIAWNYPLLGFAFIISITMNTCGNVKTPLITSICSLFLNTILVCVLSLPYANGPNLGIEGLAISLIVSRAVECLILLGYLIYKKPIYCPNWNIFNFTKDLHKKYIITFIPLFASQVLFGFSVVMLTALYSHFGNTDVVAAVQIVGTVVAIFYSTFRGYNALVGYAVGSKLGSGELELAKENAKKILKLSFIISTIIALIIVSFAFWVPKVLFPKLSPDAMELAIWYMAFSAVTYFFINMMQPLFSFLYAGGYTLIISIADLFLIWFVDIFITFALLQWTDLSIKMVIMISCLSKAADFICAYIFYKVIPWNKNIINPKVENVPHPIFEPHG
ncbi:MATE family efflux transporter [Spiroplasma endosymbiont of Polydrusus pterygomalis]|uniref:MATE family efflux transporter n=1 Tax=Spiroplasma endosymbiont of Polydrusus pterygomalis TaxID=3139327 RepID=UPI003CCACD34